MPPTFYRGDMWSAYDRADLFLIPTNCIVQGGNKLVMGAGLAREALARFPGLDAAFGAAIAGRTWYGLLVSPHWPAKKVGAFQTKFHYRHDSPLQVIAYSARLLRQWCIEHPEASVTLAFPGLGCGRRTREEVLPLLAGLPNTVRIFEKE